MCFRPVNTPEPDDERAATLDEVLPGVSITRYVAVSSFGPRFTTMSVRVPPGALGMVSTRGFGVATCHPSAQKGSSFLVAAGAASERVQAQE